MNYLGYCYDFELQGRPAGENFFLHPQQQKQQQLRVILDQSAIAAGKNGL